MFDISDYLAWALLTLRYCRSDLSSSGNMAKPIFRIFSAIINNVNGTVSFVDFQRFNRERREVLMFNSKSYEEQEQQRQQVAEKQRLEEKNRKKGFFNDLLWMLEYNQNGFMQLIICLVHILLLVSQVITSFLYISLPTDQDPVTGELINPVLRYAEYLYMTSFVHKIDLDGRYNLLIGLSTLQFLIIRLRALILRFKKAKTNRYQYKDLNIIEFDAGYGNEARYSHLELIKVFWDAFKNHECAENDLLSNCKTRKEIFEFNRKVRCLSKIDKIYYYNQIDFNRCFTCSDMLELYHRRVSQVNSELLNGKKSVSWFQYCFRVNLPGKTSFVSAPEHKIHIEPAAIFMYTCYIIGLSFMLIVDAFLCTTATLASIEYQDWSRYSIYGRSFILLKVNLTIVFIIASVWDGGLLAYCSTLLLSRSRKIVNLLKNELLFLNFHLKRMTDIYDEYNYSQNIRKRIYSKSTTSFIEYKKRFDEYERPIDSEGLIRKYNMSEFNRRQTTNDSDEELHKLIQDYGKRIREVELIKFNENIGYLLDLVEVIQMEFNDLKRSFTFLLDLYIIFGTLGSSVTLSIILSFEGLSSICFTILGTFFCCITMMFSLIIGASGEASVSSCSIMIVLPLLIVYFNLQN